MPQEYPAHDHRVGESFYTYEELKAFTNNFTDLTLVNISKFIEVKSNNQYLVVQKNLIKDAEKRLLHNIICILKMGNISEETWEKEVYTSHIVAKKLQDILNPPHEYES